MFLFQEHFINSESTIHSAGTSDKVKTSEEQSFLKKTGNHASPPIPNDVQSFLTWYTNFKIGVGVLSEKIDKECDFTDKQIVWLDGHIKILDDSKNRESFIKPSTNSYGDTWSTTPDYSGAYGQSDRFDINDHSSLGESDFWASVSLSNVRAREINVEYDAYFSTPGSGTNDVYEGKKKEYAALRDKYKDNPDVLAQLPTWDQVVEKYNESSVSMHKKRIKFEEFNAKVTELRYHQMNEGMTQAEMLDLIGAKSGTTQFDFDNNIIGVGGVYAESTRKKIKDLFLYAITIDSKLPDYTDNGQGVMISNPEKLMNIKLINSLIKNFGPTLNALREQDNVFDKACTAYLGKYHVYKNEIEQDGFIKSEPYTGNQVTVHSKIHPQDIANEYGKGFEDFWKADKEEFPLPPPPDKDAPAPVVQAYYDQVDKYKKKGVSNEPIPLNYTPASTTYVAPKPISSDIEKKDNPADIKINEMGEVAFLRLYGVDAGELEFMNIIGIGTKSIDYYKALYNAEKEPSLVNSKILNDVNTSENNAALITTGITFGIIFFPVVSKVVSKGTKYIASVFDFGGANVERKAVTKSAELLVEGQRYSSNVLVKDGDMWISELDRGFKEIRAGKLGKLEINGKTLEVKFVEGNKFRIYDKGLKKSGFEFELKNVETTVGEVTEKKIAGEEISYKVKVEEPPKNIEIKPGKVTFFSNNGAATSVKFGDEEYTFIQEKWVKSQDGTLASSELVKKINTAYSNHLENKLLWEDWVANQSTYVKLMAENGYTDFSFSSFKKYMNDSIPSFMKDIDFKFKGVKDLSELNTAIADMLNNTGYILTDAQMQMVINSISEKYGIPTIDVVEWISRNTKGLNGMVDLGKTVNTLYPDMQRVYLPRDVLGSKYIDDAYSRFMGVEPNSIFFDCSRGSLGSVGEIMSNGVYSKSRLIVDECAGNIPSVLSKIEKANLFNKRMANLFEAVLNCDSAAEVNAKIGFTLFEADGQLILYKINCNMLLKNMEDSGIISAALGKGVVFVDTGYITFPPFLSNLLLAKYPDAKAASFFVGTYNYVDFLPQLGDRGLVDAMERLGEYSSWYKSTADVITKNPGSMPDFNSLYPIDKSQDILQSSIHFLYLTRRAVMF